MAEILNGMKKKVDSRKQKIFSKEPKEKEEKEEKLKQTRQKKRNKGCR